MFRKEADRVDKSERKKRSEAGRIQEMSFENKMNKDRIAFSVLQLQQRVSVWYIFFLFQKRPQV